MMSDDTMSYSLARSASESICALGHHLLLLQLSCTILDQFDVVFQSWQQSRGLNAACDSTC